MSAQADEAWKVIICARDIKLAHDALATIDTICRSGFGGSGSASQLAFIRTMTGDQIADAIERHIADRLASVQAAIRKEPA